MADFLQELLHAEFHGWDFTTTNPDESGPGNPRKVECKGPVQGPYQGGGSWKVPGHSKCHSVHPQATYCATISYYIFVVPRPVPI